MRDKTLPMTRRRAFSVPVGFAILITLTLLMAPRVSQCQDQRVAIVSSVPDTLSPAVGNITLKWVGDPAEEVAQVVQSSLARLNGSMAPDKFSNAMRALLDTLLAMGYRNAVLRPRDFSLHNGSLGCVLQIAPGPQAYVSAQEFSGLAHTDTVWLRKLIAMTVGVPLTTAWINEARQRIQGVSSLRILDAPEVVVVAFDSPDREEVVLRWRLQEARPVRFDGIMAAGGEAAGGLTGRGSVHLTGLLRRDRSLAIRYERLPLAGTLLSVGFTDAGAFGIPLDWGLALDESDQNDHRQGIAAELRYGVGRGAQWRVECEGRWRKVTPGKSAVAVSRTTEFSLGLSHGTRQLRPDGDLSGSSHLGLTATYSHRRQFPGAAPGTSEAAGNRMLLKYDLGQTLPVGAGWSARLSAAGRSWISGVGRLGSGDEWYLGGADALRGYGDRQIAAAAGAWATLEIQRRLGASSVASIFAEGASLRGLDGSATCSRSRLPYGYGCALWMLSADRIGRLEFAWRDHAVWRDGLVRLRVSQSW